jgi:predicted transcriptional regulator
MGESSKIRICEECRTRLFFSYELMDHMRETGHKDIITFDSQNFRRLSAGDYAHNRTASQRSNSKVPDKLVKQSKLALTKGNGEDRENGAKANKKYHPTLDSLQRTTAIMKEYGSMNITSISQKSGLNRDRLDYCLEILILKRFCVVDKEQRGKRKSLRFKLTDSGIKYANYLDTLANLQEPSIDVVLEE